jgi:Kdo2-lipid IVA lauroyltransferase/acyltransferase
MNFIFTTAVQTLMTVLGLIPRLWSKKIADLLGAVWFTLDRRHRRVALDNMKIAFGSQKTQGERNQLARDVFRNIARIPFEIAWSTRLGEKDFSRSFEIKGLAHLRAALKKGKGAIMLTAHTGNWELLPFAIRYIGLAVNIIYKPIKFKPADDFIFKLRTRFGARMIPKKRSMRRILNSLQRNECIGILFDQDPGIANGVFADFFGRPTCTNKGLAFLALKTEAPVIPVFIARREMKFVIEFEKEISLVKSTDANRDLIYYSAVYNKSIENFIRRYPDQWFWVHRRWKHSSRSNLSLTP